MVILVSIVSVCVWGGYVPTGSFPVLTTEVCSGDQHKGLVTSSVNTHATRAHPHAGCLP